jgi:hypothetical protein
MNEIEFSDLECDFSDSDSITFILKGHYEDFKINMSKQALDDLVESYNENWNDED